MAPVSSDRELRDRLIEAAFACVEEGGWATLTLGSAARRADLPLAEVYRICPSKIKILWAFSDMMNEKMAAALDGAEWEERGRDRIFDATMARFDAMAPYRSALGLIFSALRRDPAQAALTVAPFHRAMAWTLETAGVPAIGLRGAMRRRAYEWIWVRVFDVWLDDEPGQAKTMAELDKRLRRAERLFEDVGPRRRSHRTKMDAADPPVEPAPTES